MRAILVNVNPLNLFAEYVTRNMVTLINNEAGLPHFQCLMNKDCTRNACADNKIVVHAPSLSP